MEPLTRSETLRVLKNMGIDIPDDTRLPDDVLDKRLRDALNASQYKDRLPSSFDMSLLPEWPMLKLGEGDTTGRSLFVAMQRGNFDELRQIVEAEAAAVPALPVNSFIDLRQTVMNVAMSLDGGFKSYALQGQGPEKEKCTVNIRIICVREFNDKTPMIVLLYRVFKPSTAAESAKWVSAQLQSNSFKGVTPLACTLLEQKLLLKIFKLNATLVPSNITIDRLPGEQNFKLSVLLPVGPLEYDSRVKLNNNLGCAVCGQKVTSRCSQCQSVSYCGADCQRADWPQHRQACRSIRGGRWYTINTKPSFAGMDNMYQAMLNKFSSSSLGFSDKASTASKIDSSTPPPNTWGDRVFLIKLQVGMGSMNPGHMMIYDKKRSFQTFMLREDNPGVFTDFFAEMLGPRGGHEGLKMYRWAKRTGDWELTVCLDRQPPATETNW